MEWLTDLIKQITVSKILSLAISIALLVFIYGHKVYPQYLEQYSGSWLPAVTLALYITLAYNILWISVIIYEKLKEYFGEIYYQIKSCLLTDIEKKLLLQLALKDGEINFKNIDYDKLGMNKLELTEIYEQMAKKSLVRIIDLNVHMVLITERGKTVARNMYKREKLKNDNT